MEVETDRQRSCSAPEGSREPGKFISEEGLLALIVESCEDAIIGQALDGTILSWNTAAEKLYGYSPAEALGQGFSLIVPPERQTESGQILERIQRGERVDPHEAVRVTKDSRRVTVLLTVSPIKDATGEIIAAAAIARDFSEDKRGGQTLRESEAMLRGLFEFAPDAIAVVDRAGQIMRVNAQAEKMFGYPREDMVGQPVEMLMSERYRDQYLKHRAGYVAEPRTPLTGVGLELYGRRKDETEFPVDIMLSPLQAIETGIVITVVRDITERKRAEQQIQDSLRREALLRREIHHRVKNNLQVISSLLFLQSTHVTDPKTLEVLRESQGRARSIALIHEKLYQSTDLTKIEFCDYVRQLVGDLFHAYGVRPEAVSLNINAEGVFLGIDAAIPCGLIINELVSNALKHGLPAGRKGKICIGLQRRNSELFVLSVYDDGVGLPGDFDLQTTRSLGLKLVGDLVRQLDGAIELERNHGTMVKITFAEPVHSEQN